MSRSREEVEELRSALAHDLKTPLAVISGYAELLRIRDDPRTREEAVARIIEATQQLTAAVNRVVDTLVPPFEDDELLPVRRVLLVDDDAALRSLIRATLPAEEFTIVEAGDVRAALAALDEQQADLVILDWRLPDGGGDEVLRTLKERASSERVLVLTAEESVAASGADAFLTKPFSPTQLLSVIDALLD